MPTWEKGGGRPGRLEVLLLEGFRRKLRWKNEDKVCNLSDITTHSILASEHTGWQLGRPRPYHDIPLYKLHHIKIPFNTNDINILPFLT